MILAYKYRVRPNRAQDASLTDMLGAFCDLYNAGVQQRREAWARSKRTLRYLDQAAELKAVREADERLAGYGFTTQQQLMRRLQKAYDAFFDRMKAYPDRLRAWRAAGADPKKRPKPPGPPRYRAKSRFDSIEFRVGDGLTVRPNGRLRVVGVPGEIKVRWHRPFPKGAVAKAAVLSRSCGHWYVCFQIEAPIPEAAPRPFSPVGIDVGLANLVALSTGETVPTPRWTAEAAAKQRRLQRALARKPNKRSRRRAKARLRLARHERRTANKRRDHLHKLSRSLMDRFSHIALEDLSIQGLARGMLAKPVHNAAWGTLAGFVRHKAAWAGGVVEMVDPRGTSQTCPECGAVAAKALSERTHRCPCGCVLDRDVAAARVVLQRADFRPGTGLRTPTERNAA